MGGGILVCAILTHLHATELTQICASGQQCNISSPQSTITNHSLIASEGITITTNIGTFTNYSDIIVGDSSNQAFSFKQNGYIAHFINYGNIHRDGSKMSFYTDGGRGVGNITNYGTMGGIEHSGSETMTINNFGVIRQFKFTTEGENNLKTRNNGKISIQNYALIINENPTTFNAYTSGASLSHLLVNGDVSFKDNDSKIILDFGENFELGKEYLLSQLTIDTGSTGKLQVDFRRLTTRSELFQLTQSGDNFIVNLVDAKTAGYSTIGSLYKANVRTMNNFYTMSNAMIYPHKYKVTTKRMQKKKRVIRRVKKVANLFNDSWIASYSTNTRKDKWVESSLSGDYMESRSLSSLQSDSNALLLSLRESQSDSWQSTLDSPSLAEGARGWVNTIESLESLESIASNESFAYKSDSNNQTRRRIATTNRTLSNQNDKYYFVLTPFVAHNLFFELGRYNLSGLEYGFITAFSGKITQSNTLGTHFMMSYGNLGDSTDKNFSITNLNLNVGLNYKLDMIWDSYIKARGDFYYFLNQVQNLSMPKALKPNNLGFGVSVSYGKEWDFRDSGMLGVEVALDYKGLKTNTITTHNNGDSTINESFSKALYHLLYVDLGLNYAKYFNTGIGLWGINTFLGIKGNITANKLSKSQIHINNLNRDVNMVLDNDKILGYANISGSYVLNHKDFDMEFSLAYYGNYGDRVISNGGGVEWRVGW